LPKNKQFRATANWIHANEPNSAKHYVRVSYESFVVMMSCREHGQTDFNSVRWTNWYWYRQ